MKKLLIAGAMLALMTAPAFAGGSYEPPKNDGGNTNVTQTNLQWQGQQQQQQQSLTNTNTANGGAGGAGGQGGQGGAGGQGGTGYGGAASATGGNASATGGNASSSSNSSSNSGGNNFTVNDDQKLQAPAVSSFIAASGPCTGIAGGGALSVAGFGFGASFASLEADCRKDEHIRIGLSAQDPTVRTHAANDWLQMEQSLFGSGAGQAPQQQGSTSAQPAAIAPEQTAQAQTYCNANWPTVIKLANHCN